MLTAQTSIRAPRRLVVPKQAYARMDTLVRIQMRPRASQVAMIRLVDTEEDVETYRPALDALKATMGTGRRSRWWTRTMASACRCTGVSVHWRVSALACRCTGLTPLTLSGGR